MPRSRQSPRQVAPSPAAPRPDLVPFGWYCALLFAVTLFAYGPALRGGFIWDDDGHVTRPDLRSLHGLGRIWFEVGATQQYYPVLHSAFWVEHLLWGDAPLGYHLVNILLHATAACLFVVFLRRLAVRGAWLAGVVFALHPVCVESVAWISEQKNTLSAVFYLLAALAYLRFERGRAPRWYALGLACFVLALLSKSVTATLPAALLVVLWWRDGRISWRRDGLALAPWFGVGAAAGLFTAWVERTLIGAAGAPFALNLGERCLLAGRVASFYLGKLLWPDNLIFVYPRWTVAAGTWWQWLFPLGATGLLLALWGRRRRGRGPLAAALLFIGTLFPALGFFNVYPFLFSYVADHFQYLASLGVIALASAGWDQWAAGPPANPPPAAARRTIPVATAAAILCLLFGLTVRQARTYGDVVTLYRTTLARNPAAWLAHSNLGNILASTGHPQEAVAEYDEALRLVPDSAGFHYDRANALVQLGRIPEALAEYAQAIRLKPDYGPAEGSLARVLAGQGRPAEAVPHFEAAIRLLPGDAEAELNLGTLLGQMGRLPGAIVHLEAGLRLRPDFPEGHNNLANALAAAGRMPEAIDEYREAVRLRPDYREARYNLSIALRNAGRMDEAMREYRQATAR
jgi:tetratricopeptide (TPR) repeat protein